MQIAVVNCRTELRNEKKAKEHKHSVLIPLLIFYTYTVTAIFLLPSHSRGSLTRFALPVLFNGTDNRISQNEFFFFMLRIAYCRSMTSDSLACFFKKRFLEAPDPEKSGKHFAVRNF